MITPDHTEPLARTCAADAPGTVLDRWRALCLGGLFAWTRFSMDAASPLHVRREID